MSSQALLCGSTCARLRIGPRCARHRARRLNPRCARTFARGDVIDMEVDVEEGDKLLDKNQGYITFNFGRGQELFVSQLDDGRLNFQELFLTGADEPDRISPTVRGDIDEQPAFYDVQEIRGIVSGDAWNYRERQDPLEHVLFSKIVTKDPYLLDFKHAYSFNCKSQEFYRIQYVAVGNAEECDDVTLRFQVSEKRFLLQAERDVPNADALYRKWDSADAGLPHEHLDYPPPPRDEGSSEGGQRQKAQKLHPAITVLSTAASDDGTPPPEVEPEVAAMESGSGSVGLDPDGGGVGLSEEALMGLPEDDDAVNSIDVPPVDLA